MEYSRSRNGSYLGSAISVDRYGTESVGHSSELPRFGRDELFYSCGPSSYVVKFDAYENSDEAKTENQERKDNEDH